LPPSPAALPDFDPIRFQQLLGQLRGRPVVVNVWASWCGPCVAEAPILSRAATDYGGRVQFLGVDVLDQRTAARAFIRKYEWPFPSVFDRDGAIRDDLGLIGQPHTLVIDATGTIVFTWSGAITESRLKEELDRLA